MSEQLDPFRNWLPLRELSLAHLTRYGDCSAVYSFRDAVTRETLKYGRTKNMRSRMFKNYISGVGGGRDNSTTQRIHRYLFVDGWIDHVEVAWLETGDAAEAERKEKTLRAAYKDRHGRLPSWDLMD